MEINDFVQSRIEAAGAMADSCWSYAVGEASPEVKRLMEVTEKALYLGIEQAKAGNRVGDIGDASQTYVEGEDFLIVREFIGYGIGPTMHESPSVPHYSEAGEGMMITIEPMVNTGAWNSKMGANGWTARTKDGGLGCRFEHTIAITKDGAKILTQQK